MDANTKSSIYKINPSLRTLGRYVKIDSEGTLPTTTADLMKDAFWTYFLQILKYEDPVPEGREINRVLLEWVTESDSFKQSKELTTGRFLISAKSAEILTEYLLNDPDVKEMLKKQEEAERLRQQAMKAYQNGDQKNGDKANEKAEQLTDQALSEFAEFAGTPEAKGLRAQASKEAAKESEEISDMMQSWGIEDGPGAMLDADKIKDILNRFDEKALTALAENIGRAEGVGKETIDANKKQTVITDAGYTRNILEAFPTPRMFITDTGVSEEMTLLTLAEYAQHGVLGMVKNTEPKRTGTMVFLIDGSGSMSGHREYIAKALLLGMARAAKNNDQQWYGFVFGSRNEITKPVGWQSTPLEVLTFATFMWHGGTDFDAGINHGIKFIESLEEPNLADLIMITDGDASISPTTGQRLKLLKESCGARFMSLLVDTGRDGTKGFADYSAFVRSNQEIAEAAKGLSEALWKERS